MPPKKLRRNLNPSATTKGVVRLDAVRLAERRGESVYVIDREEIRPPVGTSKFREQIKREIDEILAKKPGGSVSEWHERLIARFERGKQSSLKSR